MKFYKINEVDTCVVVPDCFFVPFKSKKKQLYEWYIKEFSIDEGLQSLDDIEELSKKHMFWDEIAVYDLFNCEQENKTCNIKRIGKSLYIQRPLKILEKEAKKQFEKNGNNPWCALISLTFDME